MKQSLASLGRSSALHPTETYSHHYLPRATKTLIALAVLAWSLLGEVAYSQSQHEPQLKEEKAGAEAENAGASVEIDGRPILVVFAPIGGFSAQERAERIHEKILAISRNRTIP